MKESVFQKAVKHQLESQTAFVINIHGGRFQRSGLPDLEILHRRWVGFLELKVGEYQCSSLQKKVIKQIRSRQVPVYVLRCKKVKPDIICEYYLYTLEHEDGYLLKEVDTLKHLLENLISLTKSRKGIYV